MGTDLSCNPAIVHKTGTDLPCNPMWFSLRDFPKNKKCILQNTKKEYNSSMFTRKTKIVCSIGPACDNDETIRKMIRAGMNIARFNFSHGSY